jgi:oligoribonuclease NrnB/cAMP/cGMP phosphodiesterase (DHH superfamily)
MKHIFYHRSDNDGKTSGAIIKYANPDSVLHPYEYNDPFPYDLIKDEDEIIFTDAVAPYPELLKIIDKYHTTIIDHHISLINFLKDHQLDPDGYRRNDYVAACELCWEYYFKTKLLPQSIKLISTYDCWDNRNKENWDNVVLPFQYGLRRFGMDPLSNWPFWQNLLDKIVNNPSADLDFVEENISAGKSILIYQTNVAAEIMHTNFFDAQFEGLRALCCNTNIKNNQFFASKWDESKYELMVGFDIRSDQAIRVSLYTTRNDVDVSRVAGRFGGGGHKQASGFLAKTYRIFNGQLFFVHF